MEMEASGRPRGVGPSPCKASDTAVKSEARLSRTKPPEEVQASPDEPKKSRTRSSRDQCPSPRCLDSYKELHKFFRYSSEGTVKPEEIFIFFVEKLENSSSQSDYSLIRVEDTVDQYLNLLPLSEKKRIHLIKCEVPKDELHKVSMSRIYPWSVIEKIKLLPTLLRLDGSRILEGPDLSDFQKLDLAFRRNKIKMHEEELVSSVVQTKGVVLSLSPGSCAFHGEVSRFFPESHHPVELICSCKTELKEKEMKKENRCSKMCYYATHAYEVERRRKEEPVVEVPPPVGEQKPKKEKKKKSKFGKKGKGKGKGKGKKKKK